MVLRVVILILLAICEAPLNCYAKKKIISPLDFGLCDAVTDVERYWVLYNTHIEAKKSNAPVSYKDIDTIRIEIPKDAKTIPLTNKTDFGGLVLIVSNNEKDLFLFELDQSFYPVIVRKEEVDRKSYHNAEFKSGRFLLSLNDRNPWVKNRIGYDYGHYRKDLLLIERCRSKITPVSPYNNQQTDIEAYACKVIKNKKCIKNIKFYREEHNQKQVYFIRINGQYNIELSNLELHTPKDTLVNDRLISISNSNHILVKDVTIDGSYSRKDHSGYGIELDNVSDIKFERLTGSAEWGIFGTINVNGVRMYNCVINRFDVHCYGKNIFFKRCTFNDLYNSFSSIFGSVVFTNCVFNNFTPFIIRTSYNAYPSFNLIYNNCIVRASQANNIFILGESLKGETTNEREELSQQMYPKIDIKGLKIEVPEDLNDYYFCRYGNMFLRFSDDSIPGVKHIKNVRFVKHTNTTN